MGACRHAAFFFVLFLSLLLVASIVSLWQQTIGLRVSARAPGHLRGLDSPERQEEAIGDGQRRQETNISKGNSELE